MQISFDPRNPADIQFIEKLLVGLSSNSLAEPVVAQNPGSTVTAIASAAVDCAGGVEASSHSQENASAPVTNNVVNLREVTLDETLDQTAATSKAPTSEDCKTSLRSVTDKKGLDAGMVILKKFSVSRIGELPVENYGDFIKECARGAR